MNKSISHHLLSLTHEVDHYLTHRSSKDEVLQDAGDEVEGHAEDGHHQVTDSKGQQEGVGDGAHALVDREHNDDKQVAKYTQKEDERVENDPQSVVFICMNKKNKYKNEDLCPNEQTYCLCFICKSLLSSCLLYTFTQISFCVKQ